MTGSPKNKQMKRRRWSIRLVFLAVFLAVAVPPPQPAYALVIEIPTLDALLGADFAKNIAQMISIVNSLGGILTIAQKFITSIFPSGAAGVAAAVNAQSMTLGSQIGNASTYTARTRGYTAQTGLVTEAQIDAMMPNQSAACAVLQFEQGWKLMNQGMHGLASAHTNLIVAGECKGDQADCSGAGHTQVKFKDLCNLGFFSSRTHGELPNTMGCVTPQDPTYIDRDKNLDAFLHTLQMPLASACILPDGQAYFSTSLPPGMSCQGGTAAQANYDPDPTRSQLAWVAAYKLCEHLGEEAETTVYTSGRTISPQDIVDAMKDRRLMAAQMSARSICFNALWARTACPANSAASAVASTGAAADTCAAYQKNLCTYMTTAPNPTQADVEGKLGGDPIFPSTTGLGITNEPALTNCMAGGGLSPLMAESIMDRLCGNENWMTHVMPNIAGKATDSEHYGITECRKIRDAFKQKLMLEENFMEKMIGRTVKLSSKNRYGGMTGDEGTNTIGQPRPAN